MQEHLLKNGEHKKHDIFNGFLSLINYNLVCDITGLR